MDFADYQPVPGDVQEKLLKAYFEEEKISDERQMAIGECFSRSMGIKRHPLSGWSGL